MKQYPMNTNRDKTISPCTMYPVDKCISRGIKQKY